MTKSDHWFDVAESLYKQGIAKPVIWLGDDRHEKKATNLFEGNVLSMLYHHVHYPYKIEIDNISLKDSGFFISENYLRAKDRCLKMMDRIDLYGQLSRIDREVYFNKLSMIFISAIEKESPKALIMAEAPHSHAQYLLYEVCKYFGLEIAWFNNWMIGPIMNLQDMRTMELVKKSNNSQKNNIEKYYHLVDEYILNFQKKWSGEFEHKYMTDQINSLKTINRIKDFFKNGLESWIRQSYRNLRDKILREYNPINPYHFGIFTQLRIKKKKAKNLFKSNKIFSTDKLPEGDYVFFALHYEHERNTNPDGGIYHEQLIALQRLRNFLPKTITIVTKEHPTQIYHEERGPRGRSPLIYDLISNIAGVTLIKYDIDSTYIQKNALLTASITGTASLEAAINGKKSIIFGNAWFKGCPNVYEFNELRCYDFIINQEIRRVDEINKFFKDQMKDYCIPANQNFSAELRNNSLIQEKFNQDQLEGVEALINSFLKNWKS